MIRGTLKTSYYSLEVFLPQTTSPPAPKSPIRFTRKGRKTLVAVTSNGLEHRLRAYCDDDSQEQPTEDAIFISYYSLKSEPCHSVQRDIIEDGDLFSERPFFGGPDDPSTWK